MRYARELGNGLPPEMKRIEPHENWPESWKQSYFYDRQEIYGEPLVYGYSYAYENRRRETLRLLEEVLAPGARILDLAAGQGNFSIALAEMGYRVTWNDLRADLADYVRLKDETGLVQYAPGNAFDLEFAQPFDAVLITEVIEHVAHPDEFLGHVASLVRPGGYLVMTTPNGAYFKNDLPRFSDCADPAVYESAQFRPNADGHIFLLHPDEVETLARRAGLEIDALSLFTNPLTSGHMKTESLLRAMPKGLVFGIESATRWLPRAVHVHIAARFRKPA